MIAAPKLLCSECQHENEPERVYCHNCGGRLDRSAVVPTKEKRKETHKRVSRMFDAKRAKIRAAIIRTIKSIIGAAAVAVLVEMAMAPDLPPPTKNVILVSQIRSELEQAVNRHRPIEITYDEQQVNAYLSAALKTKKSALDKPFLEFRRVVVGLNEGAFKVTTERSAFGYSIFTGALYSVAINGGKFAVEPKGGWIGRMPIHPKAMHYGSVVFADMWKALEQESRMVSKFSTIQFHDKHASLAIVAAQ